jgi:hypothetical protein
LGARTLRFIYCVELLILLAAPALWAQSNTPTPSWTATPTFTFTAVKTDTPVPPDTDTPTDSPTNTPTPTFTTNPFATPTDTFTWDPYATDTPTIGSPTATGTPTSTGTPTQTGTISPSMTFTPTQTNTPSISRASLVMLPTAFSNGWDHTDGFNWNIDFTYFIGSIISRDTSLPYLDSLEEISLAMLSTDVKYAWLSEKGDRPGEAIGFMYSFAAQTGGGSSSSASSDQSFQVGTNTMGAVYTVMSKTVFSKTAVHMGFIYGLAKTGLVSSNYSGLMPLLDSNLQTTISNDNALIPPSIFYTGFNTYFWGRNWKFEIWKPYPMDQNPVLFNTQIDGLPLAFNLGYERWDTGFALLGYVNVPITLIPTTPNY